MEYFNAMTIDKLLLEINDPALEQCYFEGFEANSLKDNSYPKYSACHRRWLDGYQTKQVLTQKNRVN